MEASVLGDIDASTEDDKLRYALELAVHQVTAKTRNADEGEKNLDETQDTIVSKKDKKKEKEVKDVPKRFLGTNRLMKLPFVIGTKEYNDHPYAGLVFLGMGTEQLEHYKEEQEEYRLDKMKEQEELN